MLKHISVAAALSALCYSGHTPAILPRESPSRPAYTPGEERYRPRPRIVRAFASGKSIGRPWLWQHKEAE